MQNLKHATYGITQEYYAFGMEMSGRAFNSNSYRFGQNSQEKTPEIQDNHYTALYWEYDARIGRRWNLDPKPQISISDYACFGNNPIFYIDVLGDSAWKIKNKWDDGYVKKYRNFVETKTDEYKKQGKQFTCEDYAINMMIDFASTNNLPFQFTNESGTYDAASDKYTNLEDFKVDVLKTSGANDLVNNKNTIPRNISDSKSGDLIIMKTGDRNAKKFNHTQVITKVDKDFVKINQGNLNYRILSQDPSNYFYGGVDLQTGVYLTKDFSYYNLSKGQSNPGNFLVQKNAVVRAWNYFNWNK